jgi:hypothetical protein
LSDFFADLELYGDIANGNIRARIEFSDDQHEEMFRESSLNHYRDFRNRRRDYVATFGRETADKMGLILEAGRSRSTTRR